MSTPKCKCRKHSKVVGAGFLASTLLCLAGFPNPAHAGLLGAGKTVQAFY